MKKKNLKNLSLHKKLISTFSQSKNMKVIGGGKSIPMHKCKYFPTDPNSDCGGYTIENCSGTMAECGDGHTVIVC